jgi:hypothetical protein
LAGYRGSQFTSKAWTDVLVAGVRISMDRRIHQSHDCQTPDEIYYTTKASMPMAIAA